MVVSRLVGFRDDGHWIWRVICHCHAHGAMVEKECLMGLEMKEMRVDSFDDGDETVDRWSFTMNTNCIHHHIIV